MTIKLPKNIKDQFEFMTNGAIQGVRTKQITPRNLLNFIESNNKVIGFENLYKYLFDSNGCQQNQLKFLNAFYGQTYEFDDESFSYKTSDDQYIVFNNETKNYFTSRANIYESMMFKSRFTRDQILDSPFDINKLTEIKIK